MRKRLLATGFLLSCLLPTTTVAGTVNFGSLAEAGTGAVYPSLGFSVAEDGFVFTSDSALNAWQTGSEFHPGGAPADTSLMDYFGGGTTVMTHGGGAPFNVTSIDFAAYGPEQYGAMSITVFGYKADSSSVSQTFNVDNPDGSRPSLQTFAFDPAFSNLVSLRFTQGAYNQGDAFQFNNIETALVPLPAGFWLLLSATFALYRFGFHRPRAGNFVCR